jgi:DNA-binding CsgD family transcriptional regulator/tetratricopeptide (TPR) repeat protein
MRPALCPVLIGRDDEARQLRAALADARAGRGSTVLLAGDAGIGKSRLAREIATEARGQGCAVLTGRAVVGGVPTPFRPFAEALAAALRSADGEVSSDLGPFLPALGRLVPYLRPTTADEAESSLVFLGEAVLRLLHALYPQDGCVLRLEDLHWADAETLALVEYLADNLGAEPVLCIGTFRPDEGSEVAELAAKLETRGSADVLQLRRLDDASVALMAQACLGQGGPPGDALAFVAERAEGNPFLVEELLAGLLDEDVLVEQEGNWQATGPVATRVPATFADAVAGRMAALDQDSRLVINGAAVLGRRFEWQLLGPMVGMDDRAISASLRAGVGMQLLATTRDGFRFRHALTQEAVLAGLLPPDRARLAGLALSAVEAAQPGLPGNWCALAAELAERSGETVHAAELLLEVGRRDLAVGALSSAEQALARAAQLARDLAAADLVVGIDEALTAVYAVSGQVDRAIEIGQLVLASIGTAQPARSADLHLQIATAAMKGGRWADAERSVRLARQLAPPSMARVDVCAAQVAIGLEDLAEAQRLATSALLAAEQAGLAEVQCEALEVLGRVARQHDLDEAERFLTRAQAVASAHGLRVPLLRAMAEIGGMDLLRGRLDRLMEARKLAEAHGSYYLSAFLDLQLATAQLKQFRADEALATATRCADLSRRFRLAALSEALIFRAAAYAIGDEREQMEAAIAEAIAADPEDLHSLGSAWGRCRGTLSLLHEELDRAWTEMDTGAAYIVASPTGPAPPFLGLWPLLGALLGKDTVAITAKVRTAHLTRHRLIAELLGYADAIVAGRQGQAAAAEVAFAAAGAKPEPIDGWYHQYARRLCGQAALADGWGDPVSWLREAEVFFQEQGHDTIAAACRGLLRRAGAVVPRRRPGDADLPERLRTVGVTGREADVLALVGDGLTNREIAERMFLSPRTVEKHVASLLAKTGLRRRAQLAGYLASLDG